MTESDKTAFFDRYLTPISVLLGAIIIAIALMFGNGGGAPKDDAQGAAVNIKDVQTEGAPYIGAENAPVTIALWFDYQCPFCQKFELETLEPLKAEYVDTGKVRIIYKDFQFLGQYSQIADRDDSTTAALFARAVWEAYPTRFHDWYVAIMTAQDEENAGFGDRASVITLTRGVEGIDADRVAQLVTDNEERYMTLIDADKAEGTAFGINGTPGAIIGKTLLTGARSYAEVKKLIDAELK